MNDKQRLWQRKLAAVGRLTDGLGKRVDSGMKETIAVLQLFGLHTRQSCEGHLTWGEPAPWVDIASPEASTVAMRRRALCETLETFEEDHNDYERVSNELRDVMQEEKKLEAMELQKIVPYLDAFYRERQVPYVLCPRTVYTDLISLRLMAEWHEVHLSCDL